MSLFPVGFDGWMSRVTFDSIIPFQTVYGLHPSISEPNLQYQSHRLPFTIPVVAPPGIWCHIPLASDTHSVATHRAPEQKTVAPEAAVRFGDTHHDTDTAVLQCAHGSLPHSFMI